MVLFEALEKEREAAEVKRSGSSYLFRCPFYKKLQIFVYKYTKLQILASRC
jgi:hypothetical protein